MSSRDINVCIGPLTAVWGARLPTLEPQTAEAGIPWNSDIGVYFVYTIYSLHNIQFSLLNAV